MAMQMSASAIAVLALYSEPGGNGNDQRGRRSRGMRLVTSEYVPSAIRYRPMTHLATAQASLPVIRSSVGS